MKSFISGITPRRLIQYLLGLLLMPFGIVTIQQCAIGVSPTSAFPFSLSAITGLSFGMWTALFNCLCVLLQLIITRKLRLSLALQFVLAVVFGWLIDLFSAMYGALRLDIANASYFLRIPVCLIGIAVQALGIVLILGAELLLPPGDSFMRTVSTQYGKPLPKTKIVCDFLWVGLALIVYLIGFITVPERVTLQKLLGTVNLGTILSAYGCGKLIGFYRRLFPALDMYRAQAGH